MVRDPEVRRTPRRRRVRARRGGPTRRGSAASGPRRRRPRRAASSGGCGERGVERLERGRGLGVEHRLGRPGRRQRDGGIRHGRTSLEGRLSPAGSPRSCATYDRSDASRDDEAGRQPLTGTLAGAPRRPRRQRHDAPRARAPRRHRADRAAALGPRARASTSPRRASARPRRWASAWQGCPSTAVYASPIERTTQTARGRRAAPRAPVRCARRRARGRLRRVDGPEARRPRQDRPLEGRAAHAVARGVPGRRVARRDAGPHGGRARSRGGRPSRASSSWSCRTPTRSRRRSRTTPASTSTCSNGSSCRPRRSPRSRSARTASRC